LEKRIEFKRDSIQTINLKKGDRIIISGPMELELTDIRVSGSLDYEVKFLLSSPIETKSIKLGPGSKNTDKSGELNGRQGKEKDRRSLN